MALSNDYVQSDLHEFSKKSLQDQKTIQEQKKPKPKPLRGLHSNSSPKSDIPIFETAISLVENPSIPDPKIFDFSTVNLDSDDRPLPNVAQCAAHLELLEAFYNIRVKILSSVALDATLGIKPNKRTVYRKEYWKEPRYRKKYTIKAVQLQDNTFQSRRTVKWPFYLSLASARFFCWAAAVQLDVDTVPKPTSIHPPPIGKNIFWSLYLPAQANR